MNVMTRAEFIEACPSVMRLFGNAERLGTAMGRAGGGQGKRTVGTGNRLDYRSARARLIVAKFLASRAVIVLAGASGLKDADGWIGHQIDEEMPETLYLDGPGFQLTVYVPTDIQAELNALIAGPAC